MKTTLEIPDPVFRRAKAKAAEPAPFMRGFGKLRPLRRETARIQRVIDREFDVIEPTTLTYARVRASLKKLGRPIPANDTWIAALVLQHRLPVMSRDEHLDAVPGLRRETW